MNQLKQTWFLSEQMDKVFDGIIYNGYEKPNTSYGYYGIYGDYRYQYYAQRYLYDYTKDEDE